MEQREQCHANARSSHVIAHVSIGVTENESRIFWISILSIENLFIIFAQQLKFSVLNAQKMEVCHLFSIRSLWKTRKTRKTVFNSIFSHKIWGRRTHFDYKMRWKRLTLREKMLTMRVWYRRTDNGNRFVSSNEVIVSYRHTRSNETSESTMSAKMLKKNVIESNETDEIKPLSVRNQLSCDCKFHWIFGRFHFVNASFFSRSCARLCYL